MITNKAAVFVMTGDLLLISLLFTGQTLYRYINIYIYSIEIIKLLYVFLNGHWISSLSPLSASDPYTTNESYLKIGVLATSM